MPALHPDSYKGLGKKEPCPGCVALEARIKALEEALKK